MGKLLRKANDGAGFIPEDDDAPTENGTDVSVDVVANDVPTVNVTDDGSVASANGDATANAEVKAPRKTRGPSQVKFEIIEFGDELPAPYVTPRGRPEGTQAQRSSKYTGLLKTVTEKAPLKWLQIAEFPNNTGAHGVIKNFSQGKTAFPDGFDASNFEFIARRIQREGTDENGESVLRPVTVLAVKFHPEGKPVAE